MADDQWWYDLNTKTAVQDNKAGRVTDRLGPYASREEAERAMQRVDERNDAYDNDPRWNDDELNQLKEIPGSAFEVVRSQAEPHLC